MKTKSQKDSKSGKKGRSGAKSSQKSQKTEGQTQPSANGKGTFLNTSKDTSTTKVEDSLTVSNTESSVINKDSSGKDSSAHSKDSTANGKDTSAHGKDSTANGKDSSAHGKGSTASGKDTSNEKSSSVNSTETTVQVEVMEERKTDQEVVSEAGEDSRQVEQHDSGNASSAGESETKAELVTTIRKELEPMCGDKDEPSTKEEEIEVEVSNLVGEGVGAQGEEVEKQPVAPAPGAPPPLLHVDGDDL